MRFPKSRAGDSGFTLLELLVVITVAGLLLGVVAPRMVDTVAHARLRSSAARIETLLRETRATAMRTSKPITVTIDAAQQTIVGSSKEFSLPHSEKVLFEPYNRTQFEAPATSLKFLPDGSSNGGAIIVAGNLDRLRIDIDWLTGRISANE
jgi:general secretion pathway protein H